MNLDNCLNNLNKDYVDSKEKKINEQIQTL